MSDHKINDPLSEADYVAHAAIDRVLKPIQFGSEKLCSRDVTILCAEGVFSFIIDELHEKASFSLKEALISSLLERRQKTLIGLVKYVKWEDAFHRKPIIRTQ